MSRRRRRRLRQRRNRAAAKAAAAVAEKPGASPSENTGEAHTNAQGGQSMGKPENIEGVMSTQGDLPCKTGCHLEAVEEHLGVSSMHVMSNQMVNTNQTRKRNFPCGNKEIQISMEDGAESSSRSCENYVGETKADNHVALGNAAIDIDCRNKDPECPQVKTTDLVGNSEERDKKRISLNRSSSQNLEESKGSDNEAFLSSTSSKEAKKKRNRGRKGKNKNHPSSSNSQDSPLPTVTGTSFLVPMVDENNCPSLKCMEMREKQNQNELVIATSSVDNEKMTEGISVKNVDSATEKMYSVVQPGLFEEKETDNVAKLLDSCMLSSNKATNHNVSLMPLQAQDSRIDVNVKTNCLHSTIEENISQNTVGGVFISSSSVVSSPYSVEDNQKIGYPKHAREDILCNQKMASASHMREAMLYPSVDRGHIDGALMFPYVHPMNELHPYNQGFNFFHTGNMYPYSVSHYHHDINIYGSGAMRNSEYELGKGYLDFSSTERSKLQEKEVAYLSTDHSSSCINPSSLSQTYNQYPTFTFSPRHSLTRFRKKKLLILDLNGLLADINQDFHNTHMADAKVRGKLVFRRPYCHDFLSFCLQNFELGIWSSRKRKNVDSVVDIIMRDFKHFLLFCWDMSRCTFTGHKTLENIHKPLVLKELRKLWNKEEPDLPWVEGDYSPSNTLLVDDSPYKALRNPPHTAIFPRSYSYLNLNDNSLGPGGDLRVYLENLAFADDVECFVHNNPFGQPFITQSDPHWSFYAQIV